MNNDFPTRRFALRPTPLAACLAMAIAAGSSAIAADAPTGHHPLRPPHTSPLLKPHRHVTAANARALHRPAQFKSYLQQKANKARTRAALSKANHPNATTAVTNCLDDGTPGNLRDAIGAAATGDVIDLSALACSTITLQTGVITVAVDDLTIKGAGAAATTIDGGNLANAYGSIFFHTGYGTLDLQNITLTNAYYNGLFATGGAVFSSGSVSLTNAAVTNSQAYGYFASGGAVFAANALTVTNSVISSNAVTSTKYDGTGGGLYGAYGLTVSNSTISGNQASSLDYYDYGYGKGGGLMTTVAATITGSTLSGNSATYGGGIAMLVPSSGASTDPLILTNSTVSGNQSVLGGGALAGFPLQTHNSTVVLNQGQYYGAGGLFLLDATELQSTIVSNNGGTTGYYDVNIGADGPSTISGANNLIMSSDIPPPADTISVDPNLQPLANNGGPTQTHALQAGSSALDKGNNVAGLAFDQRGTGFVRSSGTAPDIGAFELQAPRVAPPIRPVPTLSNWALALLAGVFGLLGWSRRRAR